MEAQRVEGTIPVTYNRAATAVVQGRLHVERARDELGLALDILADLKGRGRHPLRRTNQRIRAASIQEILADLERTEHALRSAWGR